MKRCGAMPRVEYYLWMSGDFG